MGKMKVKNMKKSVNRIQDLTPVSKTPRRFATPLY